MCLAADAHDEGGFFSIALACVLENSLKWICLVCPPLENSLDIFRLVFYKHFCMTEVLSVNLR